MEYTYGEEVVNTHQMTMVGLVLSLAAAVPAFYTMHTQLASDHEAEARRAAEHQKTLDAINQRFAVDEAEIAALASQLPKDKRDILDAIRKAENQSQAQQAAQPVYYDKTIPQAIVKQQQPIMLEVQPKSVGRKKGEQ